MPLKPKGLLKAIGIIDPPKHKLVYFFRMSCNTKFFQELVTQRLEDFEELMEAKQRAFEKNIARKLEVDQESIQAR